MAAAIVDVRKPSIRALLPVIVGYYQVRKELRGEFYAAASGRANGAGAGAGRALYKTISFVGHRKRSTNVLTQQLPKEQGERGKRSSF
jgi:hypothetical protein